MSSPIAKLSELVDSKTIGGATYKVYAQLTCYPRFDRVFVPHKPYDKLLPGMESVGKKPVTSSKPKTQDIDDVIRSLRRTKKKVHDYALMNEFDMFATFTIKSDRQNNDKSKSKVANWLKNENKRKGKFEHLLVPEFHKDGESLHFHALLKNYSGELKEVINPKDGKNLKQNGRQIFEFSSYQSGFSNVIKIDDNPKSHDKIANYVLKYITKDMPLLFGKNRYWVSSGLLLPPKQDNPPKWYLTKKPIRMYENEFGIVMDFEKSDPRITM